MHPTRLWPLLLLALLFGCPGDDNPFQGDDDAGDDDTGSADDDDDTGSADDDDDTGGPGDDDTGGPGDDDMGGESPCELYCNEIATVCTGANEQYADFMACMTACGDMPDGTPGDASGDSFSCRRTELTNAGADADTHCANAGPSGGSVCVD
jgi:hypothetical protein